MTSDKEECRCDETDLRFCEHDIAKTKQKTRQEGDDASGCILMNLVGEKGMHFETLRIAIHKVHRRFEELKREGGRGKKVSKKDHYDNSEPAAANSKINYVVHEMSDRELIKWHKGFIKYYEDEIKNHKKNLAKLKKKQAKRTRKEVRKK